jgi:hypothetical protein
MEYEQFNLTVAGLETRISFSTGEIEKTYLPVLESVFSLKSLSRTVVFLAGPPGSGKSTFAAVLQTLAQTRFDRPLTILPMDGFHFPNRYLAEHQTELKGKRVLLSTIKGRPETFDLASLREHLVSLVQGRPLSWPIYDRRIHDVIPAAIPIPPQGLFLVEGNYLLLDQPGWRELKSFAHRTVFLTGAKEVLVERLVARHIRGGKEPESASRWVEQNDGGNVDLVLNHSLPADMTIQTSAEVGCA